MAGVVADCGIAVIRWKKGDNICALLPGGGYAEYATVDGGQCFPLPQGWGFIEGASLPEAICTVWHNVFQRGRLQKGENVLVHGGSSGIGTTAIQLANIWGAKVFATAGSAPKCKACIELGAVACVNYKVADFEESFKSEGVDLILDMVGGNYMEKNIRLLKEEGRLVFINALKGNKLEIDAFTIMQKRIYITGSRLRSRSISFKSDLIEEIVRELMGVFETRQFRPVIFQTFPLQKAYLAHRMMETDTHIGKIILVNCEV